MPTNSKETKTLNAIQVRIDENVRMMAELHAMWERVDEIARDKEITKVCTITTTSSADTPIVSKPPNKRFSKEKASIPPKKLPKTTEFNSDSGIENFEKVGDHSPLVFDDNDLDINHYTISEVIKYLQTLAESPHTSSQNLAFTEHITNALVKIRERMLKQEASIPRKIEYGCEPIIKMKVDDFDCNALCDLGASISVMPKKVYD